MASPIAQRYKFYLTAHRSKGCRISHLFGVPMCLLGAALLFIRPKAAPGILLFGYLFQILGHKVFEKNNPVLLTSRDPLIIPIAAVMVARDWNRIIKRKHFYTGDFRRDKREKLHANASAV